jgi:DNA repair protein RecN (Recombination protein N)
MLQELRIKNLILIDESTIPFEMGFTVITGETGTGKSAFLSALKLLSGAKANPELIRKGEDRAFVEATFDLSRNPEIIALLKQQELDNEDDLVIQREILITGKTRCRINGFTVSISVLQAVSATIFQIHGQNEQSQLKDPVAQLQILDAFSGNESLISEYTLVWQKFRKLHNEHSAMLEKIQNLQQQKEFLEFQFKELSSAKLVVGEEESAENTLRESRNSAKILNLHSEIVGLLKSDKGLISQLQILSHKTNQMHELTGRFDQDTFKIESCLNLIEEMELNSSKLLSGQIAQADLDHLNSRLALIQKLKRKYRCGFDDLISLREQRKAEIESLDNFDLDSMDIQKKLDSQKMELSGLASKLSASRIASAKRLDQMVSHELHNLGMAHAVFLTEFLKTDLSPVGIDAIEFSCEINKGEGIRPLRNTASGGEKSRIMLALKNCIAEKDQIPLLIFDEVDTGTGGNTATRIGQSLEKLGQHHQVITITHLHQVASLAKSHIRVEKFETNNRTISHIKLLDQDERVKEISRMIGAEESAEIRTHATQLLKGGQ